MASTYTWADLLTFVKPYVQSIPTSSLDVVACDRVNRKMWQAAFFYWTLDDLTAISLVDGSQDFTIADADFYRLLRCRITWVATTNVADEKSIVEWLPPNLAQQGGLYEVRAVSSIKTTTIRLDRAFVGGTGNTFRIDGEFQTVPTKVTTTTSTIVFPDDYFEVGVEGLKWAYMVLAKDPRAGGMTVDNRNNKVYSGQYGTFMSALDDMKQAEDFGNAQAQRFPDDGLGVGRSHGGGLFGW